jgi:hypothetical protein
MRALRHLLTLSIAVAMLAMVPPPDSVDLGAGGLAGRISRIHRRLHRQPWIVRSTKACVAIVHAAPDVPAVDVYLNGELAVSALASNSATPFVELPAGDYLVQVVPMGGTVDQVVITVDSLTVEAAKAYEVVALGNVAEITAAVFDVTTYAVPASGAGLPQSRVRVVHAVPGGPNVDVALIAGDVAAPAARALPFGSAAEYLVAPAGTYRVSVTAEGGVAILDVPAFGVPGDSIVSVYAVGNADGTVGLLPVVTAAARLPAPDATPAATPAA